MPRAFEDIQLADHVRFAEYFVGKQRIAERRVARPGYQEGRWKFGDDCIEYTRRINPLRPR